MRHICLITSPLPHFKTLLNNTNFDETPSVEI